MRPPLPRVSPLRCPIGAGIAAIVPVGARPGLVGARRRRTGL